MASVYPNRKNGKIVSFKFKAYLGRDENGKQIFKCSTWTTDKAMSDSKLSALAEKKATIWEHNLLTALVEEQRASSPDEITFQDFAEKKWFPTELNNPERRNTTIDFRRNILRIAVGYLGESKLQEIDSTKIEEYLDYLKNTYKTKYGKPVSQQTLRHHYSTLNLIFDYALKLDYILLNPLSKVKAPRLSKHKVDAFTKGEVLEFIKAIDNLPPMQRLIYSLLLTTGIRRGECFGLQWGDVDFDNHIIHVERNVTYTAHGGLSVGLPKTNTGIREMPITDKVFKLLTDHKACEANKFTLTDNSFLFHATNSPSTPRDPNYITTHMRRLMKRAGLPNMSPHDLRHTCASLLLQSGADIKSVQDILGHANASTTLNFYVRSDMDAMRNATIRAFEID